MRKEFRVSEPRTLYAVRSTLLRFTFHTSRYEIHFTHFTYGYSLARFGRLRPRLEDVSRFTPSTDCHPGSNPV